MRPTLLAAVLGAIFVSQSVFADDHGDSCIQATVIHAGAIATPGILDLGDTDWFAADLVAGHLYRFAFTGAEVAGFAYPPGDCDQWIAYSVWRDGGGVRDTWVYAATSGRYTFVLHEWTPTQIFTYTVGLRDFGPRDDPESNNAADANPVLADGTATSGTIDYPGDRDVFLVLMNENTLYRLEARSLSTRFGGSVEYQGPSVVEYPSGGETFGADWGTLLAPIPAGRGAVYAISIADHGGGTGAYELRVTAVGPLSSGDDFGDTPVVAHLLPLDTPVTGFIDPPTDVDVFAVDLESGRLYAFDEPARPQFALLRHVLAPDGQTVLARARDYYTDEPSLVFAPVSGRYFFSIRDGNSGSSGAYSVRVRDLGPATDDFPQFAPSGPLVAADGGYVEGRIDFFSDADGFRVRLDGAMLYELEAVCLTANSNIDVNISDAVEFSRINWGASHAPYRPDEPSRNQFYVPAGGEYAVRVVSPYLDTPLTDYRFRVSPIRAVPADEWTGSCGGDALPIGELDANGSTPVTVLESTSDTDEFAFDVEGGHVYALERGADAWSFSAVAMAIVGDDCQDVLAESEGYLTFRAPRSERVVMRLSSVAYSWLPHWFVPHALRVVVTDLGEYPDDRGNSREHAGRLLIGDHAEEGVFEYPMDIDVFSMRLVAGEVYRLEARGGHLHTPYLAEVLDAEGVPLNWTRLYFGSGDSWQRLDFAAPATGEYFVRAIAAGSFGELGPYALRLSRDGCGGDFNRDAVVDGDDFALFLSSYFAVPSAAASDFDGSGQVDADDLADFVNAYFGCL